MNKQQKNFCFLPYVFLGIASILVSSCSIYKQQFDCPPPNGIPCASVTEIEEMIVETEKGADLLVNPESQADKSCFWCGQKKINSTFSLNTADCKRRIWICGQRKENRLMKGYYLQASEICPTPFQECVIEPEDIFSCIDRKQTRKN